MLLRGVDCVGSHILGLPSKLLALARELRSLLLRDARRLGCDTERERLPRQTNHEVRPLIAEDASDTTDLGVTAALQELVLRADWEPLLHVSLRAPVVALVLRLTTFTEACVNPSELGDAGVSRPRRNLLFKDGLSRPVCAGTVGDAFTAWGALAASLASSAC